MVDSLFYVPDKTKAKREFITFYFRFIGQCFRNVNYRLPNIIISCWGSPCWSATEIMRKGRCFAINFETRRRRAKLFPEGVFSSCVWQSCGVKYLFSLVSQHRATLVSRSVSMLQYRGQPIWVSLSIPPPRSSSTLFGKGISSDPGVNLTRIMHRLGLGIQMPSYRIFCCIFLLFQWITYSVYCNTILSCLQHKITSELVLN